MSTKFIEDEENNIFDEYTDIQQIAQRLAFLETEKFIKKLFPKLLIQFSLNNNDIIIKSFIATSNQLNALQEQVTIIFKFKVNQIIVFILHETNPQNVENEYNKILKFLKNGE